jgi:hypothetical protein
MMVTAHCPTCNALVEAEAKCPKCQGPLFPHGTEAFHEKGTLDQCPVCGAAHLYRQKDFNRKLGIALVVVGAVLAYWTWGLSLGVVALLDWLLFRRVGEVGCCYRCGAQFREMPTVGALEPFNLQLHDYYRSLKKG